jgi:hypothetical protein
VNRSKIVLLATTLALALALIAPAGSPAWAPAKSAPIHPGVQVFTEGAQCTSNVVFEEGSSVYLGQAAHCSGTGGQTETDGCSSGSLPLGTPVEVTGASKPGTLVYNSWLAMQANGETDPDTCAYNDLALIRIDPADVGKVNPSVPGLRRPDRGRLGRRPRLHRLLLRQLLAARRHHQTEPQAGRRRPGRRQRLESRRDHPDPRHPWRLRQRLPQRLR